MINGEPTNQNGFLVEAAEPLEPSRDFPSVNT